jgi:hypothetical protein
MVTPSESATVAQISSNMGHIADVPLKTEILITRQTLQ